MSGSRIFTVCALLAAVSCQMAHEPAIRQKGGKLPVVTTLFPLYDFARNVGGDKAAVSLLLPPGAEAHSFEPRPGDFLAVRRASLFVYTGEFMEPWAGGILKAIKAPELEVVDASKGIVLLSAHAGDEQGGAEHHHGADPHIWLDFKNARAMVDNIANGFAEKDPANRGYYLKNAADYNARLAALDGSYAAALKTCGKRVFAHGGHFAFGYLARRYNLQYVSAAGISPDSEPSPAKMVEMIKVMRQNGLRAIFHEELIRPNVAAAIARETGATLLPLYGAHNVAKDDFEKGVTFIAMMERNLENLKEGLECGR